MIKSCRHVIITIKIFNNGDIGQICSVDIECKSLTVDFDGNKVEYDNAELDELSLSYAITIHKSQGSEYQIVILPITMQS